MSRLATHTRIVAMAGPGLNLSEILLGPNWFREDPKETMFPGEALSVKLKEVLYHKKSNYQDVLVFDR